MHNQEKRADAAGFWNRHRTTILLIGLVFLLAFAVRFHQARYEYFFEFDGYFHSRMTSYVIQDGAPPERDPLAYYYAGGSTMPKIGWSFWYLNAGLYKIMAPFLFALEGKGFPLNAPFDESVFYWVVKILPAFYGAVIAVLLFLLGRELFGEGAGLAMGLLAGVVPSFVYRTMGGWLEPSSFGFIWLAGGLWLLARATKNPELTNKKMMLAAGAGILFSIMAISWPMYLMIPLIALGYLAIGGLLVKLHRPPEQSRAFFALTMIAFGLFLLTAFGYHGTDWVTAPIGSFNFTTPGDTGTLLMVGGLLGVLGLIGWFLGIHRMEPNQQKSWKQNAGPAIAAVLILGFVAMQLFFFLVPDIRGDNIYLQTVGEENTGHQFFGNKYSALIVLPWIGMLLLAYRIYRKPDEHAMLLLYLWTGLAWAMAFYKLKFTFGFGLPIAAMGGLVLAELFDLFKKRDSIDTKVVFAGFAFVLLIGFVAGTFFIQQNTPNIEYMRGWKNALGWIRTQTPPDSAFMNWWDEGHWLTFVGQRKAMLDNRNWDLTANADFARFATTRDPAEGYRIIDKYKPDYLLLDQDMFARSYSFGVYANQVYEPDPALSELYTSGPAVAFPCSAEGNGETATYNCGGNRIPKAQMDAIPTTYSTQPVLLDQRTSAFLYRSTNSDTLFILNTALNQTFLAKAWFGAPEMNGAFEPAFDNQGIRILKVHYDKLPAVPTAS